MGDGEGKAAAAGSQGQRRQGSVLLLLLLCYSSDDVSCEGQRCHVGDVTWRRIPDEFPRSTFEQRATMTTTTEESSECSPSGGMRMFLLL